MKFSQRIGITPVKTVLQVNDMDTDLRNGLWNVILEQFWGNIQFRHYSNEEMQFNANKYIWTNFLKKAADTFYSNYAEKNIRKWFFEAQWYEIYDFIEFIISIGFNENYKQLVESFNYILQKEVSGYRIVDFKIVQITSEEEIQSIEEALYNSDTFKSVNTHLKTALDLLADRKSPDYRNSIKESISSVEAFCKIIVNDDKATLGEALSKIEKTHKIHNALKKSLSSLYGYTSDNAGIRHALLETDVEVAFEDAKFMLVSCSAFINYFRAKIKM